MFTGIIEKTAKVLSSNNEKLILERIFDNLKIGQSIAVNGACLTLVDFDDKQMGFDVMEETFSRTNLKETPQSNHENNNQKNSYNLKNGVSRSPLGETKVVNLERALPADGRFEGHIVQGHVDGIVEFLGNKGEIFSFKKPKEYDKYFVEKGSIALNGVSLTIAHDDKKTFSVGLIPHTLKLTNLKDLKKGDKVNFECDIFAKLLLKNLSN